MVVIYRLLRENGNRAVLNNSSGADRKNSRVNYNMELGMKRVTVLCPNRVKHVKPYTSVPQSRVTSEW